MSSHSKNDKAKTSQSPSLAGKKNATSSTHFPPAKSVLGKHAREADMASRSNELSKFNHTGPLRRPLVAMASGTPANAKQFRDDSAATSEFQSAKRGRHEISATSRSGVLTGNPVAVAVAATSRTNTALTPLKGPGGEVVAHSGQFPGMSTAGQDEAHKPFYAFPSLLAKQTDPVTAVALAAHTALGGLSRPREIRGANSLTGERWVGGTGSIEKPNTSRGHDDGYDSDTERGKVARRVGIGREHLKAALSEFRKISPAAAKLTSPPSPPRSRGGMGVPGPRAPLVLPDVSKDSKAEATRKLGDFAFAGFQSLKPSKK